MKCVFLISVLLNLLLQDLCRQMMNSLQLSIQLTIQKPLDHILSNDQTKCASGRIFKAQGPLLEEILKISEQQLRGFTS